MQCRFCKTELEHVFIDLVNSPASNSFLGSISVAPTFKKTLSPGAPPIPIAPVGALEATLILNSKS